MPRRVHSIDCNWTIGHGNDVNDLVTVDEITDTNLPKSINIDDITGTDRAVFFIKNAQSNGTDHDDDCLLKINAGLRYSLSQITIVCDSDVIELFTGTFEEYNQTYRGELLDEFDGIKSYLFEIKLRKDTNCISLKFITMIDQLWIYGVHIYLKEKAVNIFQPSVNIANVDEYLSDSNRDISQNANKCKEFIEMHMNSNKSNGPPNMAALMSFINGTVEDKLSEIENNVTEDITTPENNENPQKGNNERQKKAEVSTVPLPFGLDHSIEMVKTYFDQRFLEVENKLITNIDERFRELERKQNEKFDQILALLQK